jgi:mono/diheme cytochrome c family protein
MTGMPALLELFGRFHVALVHFPIALLLAGAALSIWPRREGTQAAARWCLSLGLLGALAAAASGWVLSQEDAGAAESATLRWHRALSLLGTGLALLAWLSLRVRTLARTWLQRGSALLAALVVGTSSHLGGVMVHGEDWYSAPFEPQTQAPRIVAPVEEPKPAASAAPPTSTPAATVPAATVPAAQHVDFATQVFPILEARCLECHGPRKVRGKLRLDTREHVFDPARRSQWVIEPGRPELSELMRRVTLPAEDDDRMPNKGPPLEAEQIETLRAWIAQGAQWP